MLKYSKYIAFNINFDKPIIPLRPNSLLPTYIYIYILKLSDIILSSESTLAMSIMPRS